MHDGGLAATARDLLRFGSCCSTGDDARRLRCAGVVPPVAARRLGVDADGRSLFLESPAEASFPVAGTAASSGSVPAEHGDVLLCLGIHGQMVYVGRRTRTVCVKLSSWPDAQHPAYLQDTLRAFDAIGALTRRRRGSLI